MRVDRWSLLALMRFALATVVAMGHLRDAMPLGLFSPVAMFGAFEAVLGFLVISGYSVTVSFAQQPLGFLRRRLLRVMPVYLVCLAGTLLVSATVLHKPLPGAAEIVANVLMLNQIVTKTSILGPAWSLALECWFYALLPLLAALPARRVRLLAWLSFAAFLAFTLGRTLLQLPYFAGVGFGANVVLLGFAWFTGSQLARPDADPARALRDLGLMFAAHWALDLILQLGHRLKHGAAAQFARDDLPGLCLQAVSLWAVLRCMAWAIAPSAEPYSRSRWMNALGDWSYPLYLVHVPVYTVVLGLGVTSPTIAFGLALVLSVGLHQGVERPWRRSATRVRDAATATDSRPAPPAQGVA
jgi:peptidoglycan/LPS O-acetylase OafA/YrhL